MKRGRLTFPAAVHIADIIDAHLMGMPRERQERLLAQASLLIARRKRDLARERRSLATMRAK